MQEMRSSFIRTVVMAVFFVSGTAGLIYEVVWTRQLALIFGVTTHAVATVLAVFMGGLALGSYLFGRWIDRRRNPLVAYAVLEAGVGLYALAVGKLLAFLRPVYIALHHLELPYAVHSIVRAVLAAVILLVPTTLMGGTFPILARFFVRARADVGRTTGVLYFVNTAGAMLGVLAAGFLLIEHLGLSGATRFAAAGSLIAALAAALLARRVDQVLAPEPTDGRAEPVDGIHARDNSSLVLVCIGASGFVSLAYEVLWTRVLPRYVFNSTYAFTTMLATFLGGLALGSALHAAVLCRSRRRMLVFGALELSVGLGFMLSSYLFDQFHYGSRLHLASQVITSFSQSTQLMFVLSALILLLPAIALGATLPLATEIYSRTLIGLGRSVGRVYAVNTLGSILGSLAAGFVLIPTIGMQPTLTLLIAINFVLGFVLILAQTATVLGRVFCGGAMATGLITVVALLPRDLFRRSFAPPNHELIFYEEGTTDTVGVTVEPNGQRALVYEDRRGTAGTASYWINYTLGHIPMLLHPGEPRKVLHICFGVGNSLSAVTAHESVERVDNVELSPHVLKTADFFWTNNGVLSDPRVRTIIDDGRNFLMASRETYDVILLEPPDIFTAGVINLYAREFYQDAEAHLAPDGVMMQWIPCGEAPLDEERMLFRAFCEIFPNATAWRILENGPIALIGTKTEQTIDYQRLKEKMQRERVRQDLQLSGIADTDHLLALFIFDSSAFREFVATAAPVTDDRTILDFSMPRFLGSGFGLGTFHRFARDPDSGLRPIGIAAERRRFYFDNRRSVMSCLTNLGNEDPRTVEARIEAWATLEAPFPPIIPEEEWHRW